MPRVNITDEIVRMRAEDQSAAAFRSMQSNIAGVKASVDGLKTAFGALGIGLSAGILLNFAREAIRATAILDDMAESTGASVETLSALQRVARVGGHDFEGLTGAIARMVKGLREGDEEGNKAARALEYLGVEARDSTGAFRDQGQVFIEIARASQKYRGTAEGLAIIQDALGKGAEKYISYLADVAEGTDLLNERTREQITEAEKAQKAMNRLGVEISEVFSKSVIDALPQLNSLMESLRQIVGWFDQWREAIVRTEKAWDEFARQFIPWRQQQQQQPGRVAEGMIGGAPSQPPGGGVAGGENYLDYTKRLKAEEEARKTAKAEAERAAKEWAAWLKHREDMVRDAIKKEGEIRVAAEEKALEEMLKYNEQREEEIRDAREKTLQHNNDRGEYWTELRIKREEDYQKAVEAAEERHAQEVLDIRRKAAEAQTAAYQREWERTADAIENALANAIMQGGKSGLELFTRAMRTALLTPIISALVRPLAESIAGAINYGISSAGVGPGAGGAGGQGAAMYGMGGSAWSWRTPPIYHEEGSYASTGGGFNYGGAAAVGLMGLGAAQQYRRAGQSQDPAGEKQTAALTGIGTAIGAFWGPVGAMAGGAIGGMIGGMLGGDGAAMRTGQWVGGLGTGGGVGQQNWFGTDMAKALNEFQRQQAMAEQNLVRNLNITSEQQAAINAARAEH
jgi:hypothetical protein